MDIRQVTETIAMIEEQNFDIRTITMGISLLDCIDPDINRAADKIYEKVTTKAANLVAVGDEIAAELGIPIVNKTCISNTDFSNWCCYRCKGLCTISQSFR